MKELSPSEVDFIKKELLRQEELRNPETAGWLTHWLFNAMDEGFSVSSHQALNRGIAPVDWAGWERYAPPLGKGCMCVVIGISSVRAQRMLASNEAFDLTKAALKLKVPELGWLRKELKATFLGD